MHMCFNDSNCLLYVASALLKDSSWSEDGRKQVNKVKGKKERKKERSESQEKEKCRKAGKGEGIYT